jgi:hypothetical protein
VNDRYDDNRRLIVRRTMTTALLALSLLGLMAPTSASAAAAANPDVTAAKLISRGTAVEVTATVVCPADMSGGLYLTITQKAGSHVAQGGGSTQLACTGEPEVVVVWAAAQSGGRIFRAGEAVVTGEFYACNNDTCEQAQFNDTVHITR